MKNSNVDDWVKEEKPAKEITEGGCEKKEEIEDNVGSSKPRKERVSKRREHSTCQILLTNQLQ